VPKVVPIPEHLLGSRELLFSDARWAGITSHIPDSLAAETDARLRSAVTACCSWLLTQEMRLQAGTDTAAAMRSPGKGQRAPFPQVAESLRTAADAWVKIGKRIYDDRLGDICIYQKLEAMARDTERRVAGIRKLGKPINVAPPWPVFVRKVARCCREAGLDPTATGRIYEGAKPTWFQKFMAAIDKDVMGSRKLLGIDPTGEQFERDHRAFYAAVAKALRGDGGRGKARK
jgi:hypothetical protein